jgi:hypothetical protein
MAGLKLVNHTLNVVLNLVHLGFNITDLSFFASVFIFYLINLLLKVGTGICFLGIRHGGQLFMALNLMLNRFVLLLNYVDVGVEHVDVGVKGVVLLFGLDKGSYDFLNRGDTGLFFDLLKGVLDNFNIADVHIHQILFLLVVGLPLGKTGFEKGSRV